MFVVRWVGPLHEETARMIDSYRDVVAVERVGAVTEPEATREIVGADLLLVLQVHMRRRNRDECTAIPAKVFAYLRTGTPIIAPVQDWDLRDLVMQAPSNCVCGPYSVDAIARCLLMAHGTWKSGETRQRGPKAAGLDRYSRRTSAEQLARLLRDVVGTSGRDDREEQSSRIAATRDLSRVTPT